jgi:hypothetical protein
MGSWPGLSGLQTLRGLTPYRYLSVGLISDDPPLVQYSSSRIASPLGIIWRVFILLGIVGPILYYVVYAKPQGRGFIETLLVLLWVTGILVGIGAFLRDRAIRHEQLLRNKDGEAIFRKVRLGQPAQFVLYLRPFFIASHAPVRIRDTGFTDTFSKEARPLEVDFEWIMAEGVQSVGPLLCLREPDETHVGGGRIEITPEQNDTILDWKAAIDSLIELAALVLVIPSHTSGMIWELDRLKQRNLLHKCVFVIPPRTKTRDSSQTNNFNELHDRERNILHAMTSRKLAVPKFRSNGLLYTLDRQGLVETVYEFSEHPIYEHAKQQVVNPGMFFEGLFNVLSKSVLKEKLNEHKEGLKLKLFGIRTGVIVVLTLLSLPYVLNPRLGEDFYFINLCGWSYWGIKYFCKFRNKMERAVLSIGLAVLSLALAWLLSQIIRL